MAAALPNEPDDLLITDDELRHRIAHKADYQREKLAIQDLARLLRKEYRYIPQERSYYRHLVRTPWYVVSQHGEAGKFLLASMRTDDPAPLSRQSALLDELAAR